jgi:homoserine kinase
MSVTKPASVAAEPMVVSASAPASIGNVCVGYDVLGLAFDAARDTVTAHREAKSGIRLGRVTGIVSSLPATVEDNCALAAAEAVLKAGQARFGVRLNIDKNIPLSAGMGGSAASAVAAAGAANALLDTPFSPVELLPFALEGERVSSNPPPWDNVAPCLLGGLVITAQMDPALVTRLPIPGGVACVLFHPDRKIETQTARDLLAPTVSQNIAIEHSRHLATFLAGCAMNDLDLIAAGMQDNIVEPQRLVLLPELASVQAAALAAGALGCSFSGSGPSVFAWARQDDVQAVTAAMAKAFERSNCQATAYHAPLESDGLRIESVS